MNEHTFPSDPRATEIAAQLAEQILDEIARAGHSWARIETLAMRLASVARAARGAAG